MAYQKPKLRGMNKPPEGASVNWGDPISQGLVSAYLFNDVGVATVLDVTRANNGTFTTNIGTRSVGKFGRATLNTSTNYIDCGNSQTVRLTGGTISVWIKTSNAGSSYRAIVCKGLAYGMFLLDNVLIFYDWGSSSPRSSGINLADGKWHHVVKTWRSGVASGTNLYIDGRNVLNHTFTATGQTNSLQIGSNASSQNFAGFIDNARIYNRALTPNEVFRLYTEPFAGIVEPRLRLRSGVVVAPPASSGHVYVGRFF